MFRLADQEAPSIVFIDEIDAVRFALSLMSFIGRRSVAEVFYQTGWHQKV